MSLVLGRVGGRFVCLAASVSLALFAAFFATSAAATQVSLISRADPGVASETASLGAELLDRFPRISSDGRYVVFVSRSLNLVPGQVDTPETWDVFLRDTVAGTTVLVSRAASTTATTGNRFSYYPVLSADGRYVAFYSAATNLVHGQIDTNNRHDLFLFDRDTGTIRLVSHVAGAGTTAANPLHDILDIPPALSADGRFVAYGSGLTGIVAGQITTGLQVFLYDRTTGANVLVSHIAGAPATGGNADSYAPRISADGRYVAYDSRANNLVAGATLPAPRDILLFDRVADTNRLVSHAAGLPASGGNSDSFSPRIDSDGRFVAFQSQATNLVSGAGGAQDVFLWDRDTGAIAVASYPDASNPAQETQASLLGLSGDGGWVVFSSFNHLVAGQSGPAKSNVFLYERASGARSLVSHLPGSGTTGANGDSGQASVSADGRWVAFLSQASDLVTGAENGAEADDDVFLYDRTTGMVSLVSHPAGIPDTAVAGPSTLPEIAAGGGHVAYQSLAGDLVAGLRDGNDRSDVFVHDRAAGTAAAVSRRAADRPSASGSQESGAVGEQNSKIINIPPPMSADGRWVAFTSAAIDLVPGQVDSGATLDVFLRDRATGMTRVVSRKAGSLHTVAVAGTSRLASISADGRWVAFESDSSSLIPGQTGGGSCNVYLFDRDTGTVILVSHAPGAPTTAGNGASTAPLVSTDGSRVVFVSRASDLVDGQTETASTDDVFLFERTTGTITLVSHAGTPTTGGNDNSSLPKMSVDGRFVVFSSRATNLVAGQTDTALSDDVFLFDADSGSVTLVSHLPGSASAAAGEYSWAPAISADGAFVAFQSLARNLVAGQTDQNWDWDIFLFSRDSGAVTLVSRSAASPTTTASSASLSPWISADGNWVGFLSYGSNLVAGQTRYDPYRNSNIFLYERATGQRVLVSHFPGQPLMGASFNASLWGLSGDGRFVVFESAASELIWGGTPNEQPGPGLIFLHDRETGENILISRTAVSPTVPSRNSSSFAHLSDDGSTVVFSSYATDLVPGDDLNDEMDLFAYDNGRIGGFFTLTPCRLIDTRRPQDGPALASGAATVLHLFNVCGIPETAKSLAVNVTVVQPTAAGHLTLYRGEMTTPPAASTLNFGPGQVRSNNAILRLAASAEGTLRVLPFVTGGGTVHVLVDVVGYFE